MFLAHHESSCAELNIVLNLERNRALNTSYHTVRYCNIGSARLTVVVIPRLIIIESVTY